METEKLAAERWNKAYGKLFGQAQVDYMLEKFQSVPAMRRQMQEEGYMYRLIYSNDKPQGYMAWKLEPEKLFLSKLYLFASAHGLGLAAEAFAFLEEEGRRQGKKPCISLLTAATTGRWQPIRKTALSPCAPRLPISAAAS